MEPIVPRVHHTVVIIALSAALAMAVLLSILWQRRGGHS